VGRGYDMPCFSPITGYRSKYLSKNGKRPLVFNAKDGYTDLPVQIPCGQCIGCRLEYSRQWAIRCVHESQLYEANSFLTLTYNNENLPGDHSIDKREMQLFIKRLRKATGLKLRYFLCGEYGDANNRPHYHALIFGYDFPDKLPWSKTRKGDLLFRSKELERIWTKGYAYIGHVTFESAAYVSRYIIKKQKGKDAPEYYEIINKETGEIFRQEKEFVLMSRKPGIGAEWLKLYKKDTDKDFITIRGKKMKLPKYYDKYLETLDENDFHERKKERKKKSLKHKDNNTWERLEVRKQCQMAKLKLLTRDYENET
jgi:hypothetical protein